ncbi:hypothetical protein QYF36_011917 [Acer negundo]|nr:hypothetical protein QYF36_011917 [Acer negundo]
MSDNPNAEWDYDYGGEDSSLEKSSISFKKRRNGGDSITEGTKCLLSKGPNSRLVESFFCPRDGSSYRL